MTEDHNGSIEIAADNVTLDCAGHKVTGPGSGVGIKMWGLSQVTIRNCDVSGFHVGIALGNSEGNLIEGNHSHDNVGHPHTVGIELSGPDNIVRNNLVARNGMDGIHIASSCPSGRCVSSPNPDNNTITGNTAVAAADSESDWAGPTTTPSTTPSSPVMPGAGSVSSYRTTTP